MLRRFPAAKASHHPFVSPPQARPVSSESAAPSQYHLASRWLHWASGGAMIGAVFTILQVQNGYPAWNKCSEAQSAAKSRWMMLHKSFGLLAFMLITPRVATRLLTRAPRKLEGSGDLEHYVGLAAHAVLYGAAVVLPTTGVLMSYYGPPTSIPFFGLFQVSVKNEGGKDKALSGQLWWIHTNVGRVFEYLVPLHVAGAGFHLVRGQPILARINPFA
jgi:cytochrome b561